MNMAAHYEQCTEMARLADADLADAIRLWIDRRRAASKPVPQEVQAGLKRMGLLVPRVPSESGETGRIQ